MDLFILLFLSIAGILAAYFYNTRHYRYGYNIGKKVVKRFRPEFDKKLTSPHSQKSIQERIEMVKEMVLQLGLSEYIKDYNQIIKRLQEQIASLKKEFEIQKEKILKQFNEKDKQLTEELRKLEVTLKTKEEELFQLKRDEDNRNEVLEQRDKTKIQSPYFFSGLIQKMQDSLSESTEKLETDMLKYVYAVVIALLLIGDYYVTFFIFNDFLKIQFRDNRIAVYVFSGIIALVFLVLIERAIDFLEKSSDLKKYLKRVQTFSMLVVGLILLTIYLLMVSLSWLKNIEVLHSLLRLLFVPLIVAVAITIRKVQKEYGFSFLFTPIKVILYLLLIVISNLLLLFEVIIFYIRRYIQKEKFESKTKLTIAEEVENIKREILQKSNLQTGLKEQLEIGISNLTEEYQNNISKLEKKIDALNSEMAKIRKGCENGIVSTLSLNKATVPS